MSQLLRISLHDKKINFDLSNYLNTSSLKAFLLPDETIVSLSYEKDGEEIHCQMNEKGTAYLLPDNIFNLQCNLRSNKSPPMPSTSADTEEPTSRKRRRIDSEMQPLPMDGDIISQIEKYAWFYHTKEDHLKRSAIPVSRHLAITYRHGENKHLMKGDSIRLCCYQDQNVIVEATVVWIDDALDLVVLESKSIEICDRDLILETTEPKKGMPYILMGYSAIHGTTSHISFSAGIIASDLTPRLRFLGSSGSFKGDSGGSCWNYEGKLTGMKVTSPASGGRCGIISISNIRARILELLPLEEEADVEYYE